MKQLRGLKPPKEVTVRNALRGLQSRLRMKAPVVEAMISTEEEEKIKDELFSRPSPTPQVTIQWIDYHSIHCNCIRLLINDHSLMLLLLRSLLMMRGKEQKEHSLHPCLPSIPLFRDFTIKIALLNKKVTLLR